MKVDYWKRVEKIKNLTQKIIENLVKLTTVPIENSVIKWGMDKIFAQYNFETEYKRKIYRFDGRHLCVYPAGYELPPGMKIGDKSGPELLLRIRVDAMPNQLGELWEMVCSQHEKELCEDKRKEVVFSNKVGVDRKKEHDKALRMANEILKDFK